MHKNGFLKVSCLAATALLSLPLLCPSNARAQNVSIVRSGSFEAGPFLGVTYGLDKARLLTGGNVTYAVNKHILPYVEYSYFPAFIRTAPVAGLIQSSKVPFQDIHAGIHIRIPIKESPIVPYGVLGLGVLHFSSYQVTFKNADGTPTVQPPYTVPSAAKFALNFGGGLRYYFGQRWGARVEAKVYKPTDNSATGPQSFKQVFGKVEVGVFYQFR